MTHVQIFLSTVSAEFRSYRDALRRDLDAPNVTVKVQEDFISTGTETLDKLDEYIRQCHAVIHLVGDMTGALAQAPSVAVIRQRYPDLAERLPVLGPFLDPGAPALSYTQWEAWLALYHRKVLIIAAPEDGAPRDERYQFVEDQRAAQQDHLARLATVERYPEIRFADANRIAVDMLRSKLPEILALAGAVSPNLPYLSIGEAFKGRETLIDDLSRSLGPVPKSRATPVVARVLNGMGGVGKTRLALEYAWRRAGEYTALLFGIADSREALQRNLAALCKVLNLPEQGETDEGRQLDAVLGWLRQHPGWLLILDNVDTKDAARAAQSLLPKLPGGHVLLTSRLSKWSAGMEALPVHLIDPPAAADFLLARTASSRRKQPDDAAQALILAGELGYLALALEQAGAYIDYREQSFAAYLKEWRTQRDALLAWVDNLLPDQRSVAITWQTSFDQLGEPARRLLHRLAWFEAEPIPESLLEVSVPDLDAAEADPIGSLAELKAYSLVTRSADAPSFSVHRLVQEVTRRSQRDDPAHTSLTEALEWIDAAFGGGDPVDMRDWLVLDPLAPHARAVTAHADAAEIAEPTAHLMNQAGALLFAKALHAEAEPLMRRALAIDEAFFGAEHLIVAIRLNNLAQLLQATNRLPEAEPLIRRALAIDEAIFGADHPNVAIRLNNLAQLLHDTNRLPEAEPLMRRALAIDEAIFGPEHPDVNRAVARDLNNLAQLLKATNRLPEAEPLMRRALAIAEASFGADHPNVADPLNNLAQLLQDTNRVQEAEPLMRRALEVCIGSLGTEHPRFYTVAQNYVVLRQAMGKTEDEIKGELVSLLQQG